MNISSIQYFFHFYFSFLKSPSSYYRFSLFVFLFFIQIWILCHIYSSECYSPTFVHCSFNLLSLVATHGVQDGRIAKTAPSLYLSDVTAPTDSKTPLAGTLVSRARTKVRLFPNDYEINRGPASQLGLRWPPLHAIARCCYTQYCFPSLFYSSSLLLIVFHPLLALCPLVAHSLGNPNAIQHEYSRVSWL